MSRGLLNDVTDCLAAAGVQYALIGAGALAVHGVSRSTLDVDLFTTDAAVLDSAVWALVTASSRIQVEIRRGDADDPLAGVVRITRAGERDIDVVVGRHGWQTDIVTRSLPVQLATLQLPVVGAADLILLKLYAGGPQDFWDIEQLMAREGRQDLCDDVASRVGQLPRECQASWTRLVSGR